MFYGWNDTYFTVRFLVFGLVGAVQVFVYFVQQPDQELLRVVLL